MDGRKFLGICIVLAALIIAGAIIWHARTASRIGRYQMIMHQDPAVIWVIDTTTGEISVRL